MAFPLGRPRVDFDCTLTYMLHTSSPANSYFRLSTRASNTSRSGQKKHFLGSQTTEGSAGTFCWVFQTACHTNRAAELCTRHGLNFPRRR